MLDPYSLACGDPLGAVIRAVGWQSGVSFQLAIEQSITPETVDVPTTASVEEEAGASKIVRSQARACERGGRTAEEQHGQSPTSASVTNCTARLPILEDDHAGKT